MPPSKPQRAPKALSLNERRAAKARIAETALAAAQASHPMGIPPGKHGKIALVLARFDKTRRA